MLLECAQNSVRQTSSLHALGLVLGIQEWGDNFNQRLIAPKECLEEISSMDVEPDAVIVVSDIFVNGKATVKVSPREMYFAFLASFFQKIVSETHNNFRKYLERNF